MEFFNWSGIFGQKRNPDFYKKADVNKPVENIKLKRAFESFQSNKSEDNLEEVINGLLTAKFLILAVTDEMKTSKNSSNTLTVEKGSVIKFLNCFDENNLPFLPAFTDWHEVELWLTKRESYINGFIMNTFEVFEFANNSESYHGVVINPGSNGWAMNRQQVENFLVDHKK